jgi:hypothetical protein
MRCRRPRCADTGGFGVSLLSGLHIVGWPLLAGAVLEAAAPGFAARLVPGGVAARMRLDTVRRAVLIGLHVCVAAMLIYTAFAFLRPAYNEWVESGVAAMAREWVAGHGMYPAHAPPGKYSVYPYGPLLFQLIGALYIASAGNGLAAKAAFIAIALSAYASMFFVLLRQGRGAVHSALAIELMAIAVTIMAFMVKADILLILVAILSCWVLTYRGRMWHAWLALSILAGVAAAVKIHGVFYVLPAAIMCLSTWRGLWALKIGAAVVVALVVSLVPFLVPGTSLANYIYVLRVASQDGWLPGIFVSNLAFLGMFVLAVHLLVPAWARDARYRIALASVLIAGVGVSVVAAKPEAGPHHLVPLLPYLCAPLATGLAERFDARRALLSLLFLVSLQPVSSCCIYVARMLAHWQSPSPLI